MGRSGAIRGVLTAVWTEMRRGLGLAFYNRLQELLREAGSTRHGTGLQALSLARELAHGVGQILKHKGLD